MFTRLFNFIRGYVVVAVSGFSAERFINLAAGRSVFLWNVSRNEGRLVLSVSIKGFRTLRACAKKSGCRMRIIRKTGLPFILFKYKKRKLLALGPLLFVIGAAYLTSFVWLVTVTGNVGVETGALTQKLEEMGVKAGVKKAGINLREVERELMAAFDGIAFVNLEIKGSRATLRVVEGVRPPDPSDEEIAADIVAAKDGVVVSMATELGRPVTRPGDVVKAGDTLVSGEVIVGSDEYGYTSYWVRASSEVLAKRFYEYVFDVPLTYILKSFTGNVTRNYGIILFDKKIYLANNAGSFISYDKSYKENRLSFGEDYPLPALWFEESHREFIPLTIRRTLEEAEIMGRTIADARILRELPEGTEITSKEFGFKVNGNSLTVSAYVTAIESIGKEIPITASPEPPGVQAPVSQPAG